ncbi:squamosa promoter-binding protein 15 [Micromonospora sp. NPDC048169]|uniref:squamosa promoter-binding protein 15 n=1 Tax=unclassified Micromonospora TaxID=2617518 RepID=UPI0033CE5D9C
MSWVANVMLSVGLTDRRNAEAFIGWLDTRCRCREPGTSSGCCGSLRLVTAVDNQWGGHKNPECQVFAGALNHADLTAVVTRFGSVAWHNPNAVQLFVMDQEQFFFRVWMIRDGALRQYAPSSPDEDDDGFWPPAGGVTDLGKRRSPGR